MEELGCTGQVLFHRYEIGRWKQLKTTSQFEVSLQLSRRPKCDANVKGVSSRTPTCLPLCNIRGYRNGGTPYLGAKLKAFARRQPLRQIVGGNGEVHCNLPRVEVSKTTNWDLSRDLTFCTAPVARELQDQQDPAVSA